MAFYSSLPNIVSWEGVAFIRSGPEIIKLFSCSTQLSTKFQLLIKTKIPTNKDVSCYKSLRCWHFYIYEQDKFRAQLS